jgi:DNA-binding winged helix-turn-helix (wHTH) protein
MHPMDEEIRFGRFRLDLRGPELRRDDQPVRIHRRALGILRALAEAKGEIVSKDELMAQLWPAGSSKRETSTSMFRLSESR